jgi:hypothetical protein
MVQLEEKIDGHIILYCKGHYNLKDVDFIVGLQRIWAIRCGLSVEHISSFFNEYLANHLHNIFAKCSPRKLSYFHQILNKGLCDNWEYDGLSGIERAIMVYRVELMQLQIKEEKRKILIKLPKPQKRLFKKIVSGKGQYNDYKLIK